LSDDTSEPGEPNHAGAAAGKSRWWRWVAPESAHVAVQTCFSGFESVLGVYTGPTLATLDEVGSSVRSPWCRGDAGGRVAFHARAGEIYAIAVAGYPDLVSTHVTPSILLDILRAASVSVQLRSDTSGSAARLNYRAAPTERNDITIGLERDAQGVSLFTARPRNWAGVTFGDRVEPQLSPGRGCSHRLDLLDCVLPAGARAMGPLLHLGDRGDYARVTFADEATRVFGGRGDDFVIAGGRIAGGPGDDKIRAPSGQPSDLNGGRGEDEITGSRRRDRIDPGPGRDEVSGRGGGDLITTRDGFIDLPECGGRGTALIDALDNYPARCTRVRRHGAARAIPVRVVHRERGWPAVTTFIVDLVCPRDGPRVCRGTVTVTGSHGGTLRKPFRLPRRRKRASVRFPISAAEVRGLLPRDRVVVRSRDRNGRPRTAAGIFEPERDFAERAPLSRR
jgi:hypothetical protein